MRDAPRTLRQSKYPMISVDDALSSIFQQVETNRNLQITNINAEDAIGHIVAEDVYSPVNVPPFRASVMDGYAIHSSSGSGIYEVVGRVTAGMDSSTCPALQRGQAYYITTGSALPAGADTVVKIEDTESVLNTNGDTAKSNNQPSELPENDTIQEEEKYVKINITPSSCTFIREIGCDLSKDSIVFPKNHIVSAYDVGLCYSVGIRNIPCISPPKIGVISTGDELIDIEELSAADKNAIEHGNGKIVDSNRPALLALYRKYSNAIVQDLGILRDAEGFNSLRSKLLNKS